MKTKNDLCSLKSEKLVSRNQWGMKLILSNPIKFKRPAALALALLAMLATA
ncbi:MAG: hypothetical protein WBN22_00315 [Verrucomicrobiia bacterium]